MTEASTSFTLDTTSGMPIYRQIVDWVKVGAASRQMLPGEQLPTVRQLAVDLHVNYNTVARAYLELEHLGLVNTLRGRGTFIADHDVDDDELVRSAKLRGLVTEFLSKAAEFGLGPKEILAELSDRISDHEEEEKS